MRPDRIYNLIKDQLKATEKEIRTELSSDVPIITSMGRYITESGGKRIRPALLCLAASACGYDGSKAARYGVVFEFVHTATLIHDDIIDSSKLRRGRPVVHEQFGTTLSILFGDYLFNTAMGMALRDDNLRIIRLICDATARMIEGEIIQAERNFSTGISLEDYMDLIRRKTAYIFSCCAQAGAILADSDKETEKALRDFGLNMGIAFQLIDDYFDYASTAKRLGKPVGNDLLEGKVTYPVLLLFERMGEEALKLVEEFFENRSMGGDEVQRIIEMLIRYDTLEDTKAKAGEFAQKAKNALGILPPSKYLEALLELPAFVVNRRK